MRVGLIFGLLCDVMDVRAVSLGRAEAVVYGRRGYDVRARGTVEDTRLVYSRVHVGGGARFWASERWGGGGGSPARFRAIGCVLCGASLILRWCGGGSWFPESVLNKEDAPVREKTKSHKLGDA